MNKFKFIFFALVLLVIILSCEKEKIIAEVLIEPSLVLSTDTLIFDKEETKKLYLTTIPVSKCEYQVITLPDWVEVNPESGIIDNDIEEISITSVFSGMEPGIYSDELIVMSTSGMDTVMLIGLIEEQLLYSIPDSIKFSITSENEKFIIKNQGNVSIAYDLTSSTNYIDLQSATGEVLVGEQKEITITLNRELLGAGSYFSEIYLNINEVTDTIVVQVDNHLQYSIPESINFSVFSVSEKLIIKNEGNFSLNYNLTSPDSYIILQSETGEILIGEQKEILVNVNREELETGTYFSKIYLTINGVADSVAISIDIFKEQKQIVEAYIVDAEYSKATDKVVFVTTNSLLTIYDVSTKITESITLSFVPTCLSISLDGTKAVVGHDAHVTYVNLQTKEIINTHNVSCNALDIVLGENEWAYVFPKQNQWARIRCIDVDLNNSTETLHTGSSIYAGTKAKLQPSGKYIYGADNGISPSDLEKYDIQNGTAIYLYDSPYHGDYSISGDLWFSEDGNRIFTRGKNVFTTSETREQDMLYNGAISFESTSTNNYARIIWLDHLELKKNLYIITSGDYYWDDENKPYVYVYNSDNLTFRYTIDLEEYMVPDNSGGGEFYPAEPYYVFSKSSGEEIYVITKAVGSGLVNEWAIQTFDIK